MLRTARRADVLKKQNCFRNLTDRMSMKKAAKLLLILVALSALSWGVYQCKYQYSYEADLADRPWAYTDEENAKLLVGTWQGQFRDPDGMAKTIRLRIVEPVTDEERAKKAARRLGPITYAQVDLIREC
ncbi:MAG: hypothetical protein LH606_20790 [Cytophagaceae bacterium]|nr:hypothetical protein [Cytophagaceae bacterium]